MNTVIENINYDQLIEEEGREEESKWRKKKERGNYKLWIEFAYQIL